MDRFAMATANLLVGNPEGAAALECALSGPSLTALAGCLVAVTGADFQATLNGQAWYTAACRQTYSVDSWELLYSRGGRAATVLVFAALGFFFPSVELKATIAPAIAAARTKLTAIPMYSFTTRTRDQYTLSSASRRDCPGREGATANADNTTTGATACDHRIALPIAGARLEMSAMPPASAAALSTSLPRGF